jgi:HipA-like protein
MRAAMKRAKEWLGWKRDMEVGPEVRAEFQLFLDSLLVGTLTAADQHWVFRYSDDFKVKDDLRPLVEFPDLNRVYDNDRLWQFFAGRIPSTEQPDVERLLQRKKIADDDVIELLKLFGKRTVTNPFELRFEKATV